MVAIRNNHPKQVSSKENSQIDRVDEASIINPLFFSEEQLELTTDSSRVRFYMDTNLVFINSTCNSLMLRNLLGWYEKTCVAVIYNRGKIIGIVTKEYLDQKQGVLAGHSAGNVVIPWSDVKTINSHESIEAAFSLFKTSALIMVMHRKRPIGILSRESVFNLGKSNKARELSIFAGTTAIGGSSIKKIVDMFPEGLIILDDNENVLYYNKQVAKLLQKRQQGLLGKKFELVFGWLFAKNHQEFLENCHINTVIKTRESINDIKQNTVTGRTLLVNYHPIIERKCLRFIVINFRDITLCKIHEGKTRDDYEELSHVFRLMMPNSKIEKKLRSIPEYKDYFDHNTGFLEIVEVIADGAYRHVINSLKLTSELLEKGVFNLPGLDCNTVVQALISHDVGKKQPRLGIGDMIDPKTCFSEGKVHAKESAKIISEYPFISPDIILLVNFHHHDETELPDFFPARLLPMLRLIKLIDGLSAGLTRRDVEINLSLKRSKIMICEKNDSVLYNGIKEIDLLSGETRFHQFE